MSTVPAPPKHYFVDEAGDPVLFDGKGRVLIGTEGCSRYFAVGLLDVADAAKLAAELDQLRAGLLADPYFKNVPSMQPEARKTALYFHAKDDLPEVRREVFKLLQRHELKFSAVARAAATSPVSVPASLISTRRIVGRRMTSGSRPGGAVIDFRKSKSAVR